MGRITVTLESGEKRTGTLHEVFKGAGGELMGKCVNLASAYKQCPVAQKHAPVAVFALKNQETGEVEFFEACALPFGATAAVHGFNRCATALNHTAHRVIAAPCSHYFDDFTLIVPRALAEKIADKVIALFEIPGWKQRMECTSPRAKPW